MTAAINVVEAKNFIELVQSGLSQTEAAKKLGRSQSGMIVAARRHGIISGRLPSQNDASGVSLEQILALHKSGLAKTEIAKKVGLHVSTVSDKLAKAKSNAAACAKVSAPTVQTGGKPKAAVKLALRENTDPLPAGSATSWSALGMDIPWKRACELTAHLRPH